ncbi:MAG: 6-phosphogluconolactonase [Candidatus Limnocylindria bacterium]
MSVPTFETYPDPSAVAAATADRFLVEGQAAIEQRGRFRVALSGGSTPKLVFPLLVSAPRRAQIDWSRVEFFWVDERAVPPDHPESNFGVAYQMLIAPLTGGPRGVRADAVHRMQAEVADLDGAALAYEGELRLAFEARGAEPPRFDLICLGMGPDGHTASLFPESAALTVADRWVVANWAPGPAAWRMTLTFPVLDAARLALFTVTGADKADALRGVRSGAALPAGRVRGERVTWLVDQAAESAPNATLRA